MLKYSENKGALRIKRRLWNDGKEHFPGKLHEPSLRRGDTEWVRVVFPGKFFHN